VESKSSSDIRTEDEEDEPSEEGYELDSVAQTEINR
jgi:hypothetical protein